jgi:hypothetical protein
VCRRCGGGDFGVRELRDGSVEQVTRIAHAVGGASGDVLLASVRLDGGPVVIARLQAPAEAGAAVHVEATAAGLRASAVEPNE